MVRISIRSGSGGFNEIFRNNEPGKHIIKKRKIVYIEGKQGFPDIIS